jgi:hypothetical protein
MTFDVFGHLHAYMQPCVHGNRSMHTWLLVTRTRTRTVSYVVNYTHALDRYRGTRMHVM